ncbi:glucose dehydrogenase-like protein 3 [Sarcoptes scabiei]|uniref:Glucose dehydrogenase-like protein 3 n=1 Tax=Sarcoptes scabiei TaxID=52283 RepID=A0A132AHP0_SARSC|nr:glucose dehydrogenase-like protein 3 [Sarcoptes scabiei]
MPLSLTTQLLTFALISLQRQSLHNSNVNRTQFEQIYDFIVVGSGSSGSVVANRLASRPNQKVLLLEAGGPQTVVTDTPGLTSTLVDSEFDWKYRTVPQTEIGQAFRDRRIRQPKGKVLGGTSTINWMLYNRGNRRSYDAWNTTYGCDGWDYQSILPYFIRSENTVSEEIVNANPDYHGTQGPMVRNKSLLNDPVGPTVQQFYEFYQNGTGVLSELPNSITFFSTKSNDDEQFPNAIIDVNTYHVVPNLTEVMKQYGSNLEEWREFWRPYLGQQYALITSAIYRTYSRGTIRLASNDPFEHPLIDPQYLTDRRDLEALVEMTKILFYVTHTGDLAQHIDLFPRPIPGCQFCADRPIYQCDSYIRCIIRNVADTALHPGGACRMGSADRNDIVVDPRLRVKGIERLRVIDSSIIPELANANTHAASVMIGERGAQFIIDHYGL